MNFRTKACARPRLRKNIACRSFRLESTTWLATDANSPTCVAALASFLCETVLVWARGSVRTTSSGCGAEELSKASAAASSWLPTWGQMAATAETVGGGFGSSSSSYTARLPASTGPETNMRTPEMTDTAANTSPVQDVTPSASCKQNIPVATLNKMFPIVLRGTNTSTSQHRSVGRPRR